MKLLRALFGPFDPGQASVDHFRARFARTLILAGCLFLAIFALLDWQVGLRFVAVADVVLAVVLLLAALYMRQRGDIPNGIRICIVALFAWFLATLPNSILICLWLPIFPLAAFFGLGRREGLRWSLAFLVAVGLEMLISLQLGVAVASKMFLFSAVASLSLVVLTVIFYQRLLEIFEQAVRIQSEQFQQAQRMESIGLLASGVAHDFNNLLVGVMGNAEVALMSTSPDDPMREQLEGMLASAERGRRLVRQLLAYAGKGAWRARRIDIHQVLDESRPLMQAVMKEKGELRLELTGENLMVSADDTQLQQLLLNLLANAVDAASPERACRVVVRTGSEHRSLGDFRDCPVCHVSKPGNFVFIEVEDNGLGMSEGVRQRIFEPFFTTKQAGSGLGLAAVAGTLRSLHGALEIHSELGRGSRFTLWIPALSSVRPQSPAKPPRPVEYRMSGTVLLVDDDRMVRQVGAALLENAGLRVLEAEDGYQALELYARERERVDVLILDYAMPKVNGTEVFDAVRRENPGLPVIISSGYHQLEEIARMRQAGAGFVKKPFRVHELLMEVQRHLPSPEAER